MNDVMELNTKFLDYNNNFNKTFAQSSTVNALESNINSVRDYKFAQLESYKDQIARIHLKLMNQKQVSSGGNSMITSIQMLLGPKLKEQFLMQQGSDSINHNNLFKNMNNLNGCFLDIIDSVCSYKVELGIMLQKLVESYNSIFLQQYQTFYDGKLQREKDLDMEILRYKGKQKEAQDEQDKLIKQQQKDMGTNDVTLRKEVVALRAENVMHQDKS